MLLRSCCAALRANTVRLGLKTISTNCHGPIPERYLASAIPSVSRLVGREVLDSRGYPTVEADVYAMVKGKEVFVTRQAAPSGASTGSGEALELRDGDLARYSGKGVRTAVKNVSEALSEAVKGKDICDMKALDGILCTTDGDPLKKNLGGNAITAASFALAEAGAKVSEKELFEHFASFFHAEGKEPEYFMPRPMVNILNGGKHAGNDLRIQEFMIVPKGGIPFKEMLRHVATVYHHLKIVLIDEFGKSAKNLGDEGGYAPGELKNPTTTLSLIEEAVVAADLKMNEDIFLALDCAMSEYFNKSEKVENKDKYELKAGKFMYVDDVIDYYVKLKKKHPALISIEDGLDEKDYDGWIKLTKTFKEQFPEVMIVGDDLYTTNPTTIEEGIAGEWCNALLLKVNQIGTISEAMGAARMIMKEDQNVIVSHRSGETTGSLIADLAVGIGAQFIKTGATARGERIAKYNRLLQIDEFLQESGRVVY